MKRETVVDCLILGGLVVVAFLLSVALHGQQPAMAAPTKVQTAEILQAVKINQAAQLLVQTDQWAANASTQAVLDAVARTKKALGLDETWDFSFQTGVFQKRPPAPAAPAQAPPGAAAPSRPSPPTQPEAMPAPAAGREQPKK